VASVLANLKSGNLEQVDNPDAALQAGTHGIPLFSPQGDPQVASNPQQAAQMVQNGFTQPTPDQLHSGLLRGAVDTPMEKIGSFLEGAGCGAGSVYTGPLPAFQAAEASIGNAFGIKELSPEYMAARRKYNPGYEMAGQVGGGIGALVFGGEGTAAYTLPAMAEKAVANQFGKQLPALGSMAAKAAVGQAIFSGNQELGKFIYDPSQTVEKAVANTTLNAAIGGIAGVAIGSIPALWEKTANAVNSSKILQGIKDTANVTPSGQDLTSAVTDAGLAVDTPTKALFSANPHVSQAGVNAGGLDAVTQQAPGAMVKGLGATPEEQMAIETPPGVGDRQAAGPVRQALVQGAKARYNAQAQTWEGLDQRLQGATLNPESQTALADASSAFQEKYAKFQNTSPEFNIMQGAQKDIPGLKTLGDVQEWASRVGGKLWNNNEVPQASYWDFRKGIDTWMDQFKLSAASAMDPNLVPELQAARGAYADTMGYFRNLSTALKMAGPKGGPAGGPAAWIDHLSNPLEVTDSQLLSKTIQPDNDALLQFFKEQMPEAVPQINAAFRQKAMQASLGSDGTVNPLKLWNYVQRNWSPATQAQVIGQDGLRQMGNLADVLQRTSGMSPSQGVFQRVLKHFAGGVVMMAAHAAGAPFGALALGNLAGLGKLTDTIAAKGVDGVRLAFLRYLENGLPDVPAFKAAADYMQNAVQGHLVMQKAISTILEKGGSPDQLPKQAQPDPKGAGQLGTLMDKYAQTPGSMMGIGGNLGTYFPEHQMELANLSGRAQQYLAQLKPQTQPLGPLDSAIQPSAVDQARYDRALNLVNKPMSILTHIAKGNVTQDDMGAMELYPSLTKEIQQRLMEGVISQKAKGKTIPYQQRLALSTFLGQNLDSTIGPMTMMTLQGMQRPPQPPMQGRPGRGHAPGGAKKPPQGAFTKMQQGASQNMTMAQKAESDRVGQQ